MQTARNYKEVPHNIDAEESVIGSILLDGSVASELSLIPADFHYEPNGMIYAAAKALSERGIGVGQITIAQELHERGQLDAIGGVAHLSHLISICPTSLDCHYYAAIVQRLSTYRQMIGLGDKISAIGYEAAADLPASIAKADDMLLGLRKQSSQLSVIPPDERIKILASRYDELLKVEGGVALATGLTDLDRELGGGLYAGDLVIVAGRPGMGKTAIMQNIANNISLKHNILFCSAEMSMAAIGDREIAGLLGVKIQKVRLGGYDEEMYLTMTGEAMEALRKRNVYFCDDIPLTTSKIMQAAISTQLRYGLSAIFVDYLGLLADDGDNEVQRLGRMTRILKEIARKLNVPVVVAHQLNRAVEQRMVKDKRPQLSDLRDSGSIEQDADVVLMMYRDSYYQTLQYHERVFLAKFGDGEVKWEQAPETLKDYFVSEVIIRKHRQGESNVAVRVWFDRKHQQYCNLAKEA